MALTLTLAAQTQDTKLQVSLDEMKAQIADFDTEHLLDSLDQEKLPHLVSGGLLAGANMSNFIKFAGVPINYIIDTIQVNKPQNHNQTF